MVSQFCNRLPSPLMLDEAPNGLSIETLHALEKALLSFPNIMSKRFSVDG
ncbi:hypothetical protein N9J26_00775 [bacterium]|nr:hypothetical protein [bacterium]